MIRVQAFIINCKEEHNHFLKLFMPSKVETESANMAVVDSLVAGKHGLQVVSPQSPSLHQSVVHLDCRGERLIGLIRAVYLSQEHALEGIELGCHLLGEVLQVGGLDHLQALKYQGKCLHNVVIKLRKPYLFFFKLYL